MTQFTSTSTIGNSQITIQFDLNRNRPRARDSFLTAIAVYLGGYARTNRVRRKRVDAMQVAGMLYGAKLLHFAGFPSSEVVPSQ